MYMNSDDIMLYNNAYKPSNIYNQSNATYMYFWRYLFTKFMSKFDITIPDHWERNYFEGILFAKGYIAVFDSKKYGLMAQDCALSGMGLFRQPTHALINNQYFSYGGLEIGRNVALIRCSRDYMGVCDTVNFYAEKLALLDASISMSIVNSKFAYVLAAKNKRAKTTIEAIFDSINEGKPVVVYDQNADFTKEEPWNFIERNVKNSFVLGELLDAYRTIISEFETAVGIPNVGIEKKERLISSEVIAHNSEATSMSDQIIKYVSESMEKANSLYPALNLSIKLHEFEGGVQNAKNDVTGGNASNA